MITRDNITEFDRSVIPAAVLLFFLLLCCLLTACAQRRVSIPDRASEAFRENFIDSLNDFHMEILAENHGICPGPDGKNMIFLGRDAKFQLVTRFTQTPPANVRADDLVARIAHLSIPFARRASEKTYMTDIVDLGSQGHGLNTYPAVVSLFYRTRNGEVLLGTHGMLAIDTTPPLKPTGLYLLETGPDYFSLTWQNGDREIKECLVQKWLSGRWVTLLSGFISPPVRINSRPEGRVRVVIVDCALNRAFSGELILGRDDNLYITRTGCGKNRYMAYSGAQVLINDGFVREYVSPWLKTNTRLTNGEINKLITERHEGWVPPGIKYTPPNKVKYYKENGKWCTVVTGAINRTHFMEWVRKRAKNSK